MSEDFKWNEAAILGAIGRQTLQRKCVLLVDRCNWTGYECDVLGVTHDLRIIDIEIKISRADFKADAKKDKWWIRQFVGWGPETERHDSGGGLVGVSRERIVDATPRLWPPRVWKHYFAVPRAVWRPELVEFLPSAASGVLLLDPPGARHREIAVECVRRATPDKNADKLSASQVMDIARLANLRMWDAYEKAGRA